MTTPLRTWLRRGVAAAVLTAGVSVAAQQPPGTLLREPYTPARTAEMVPAPGAPIEFDAAGTLDLAYPLTGTTFTVRLRSRHPGLLPVTGLTLRVAIGPMDDGTMFTMRMEPLVVAGLGAARHRNSIADLVPGAWETVVFSRLAADPVPPMTVMNRSLRVVATLERVTSADDVEVWVNPDTRELLWNALRAVTQTDPPG
ncbi:MAG: hypothetical protein Q8L86_00340 [Vicinamibacterales bacterium]|nr:hypothetical protein [Vicinamibacterales bacterium]